MEHYIILARSVTYAQRMRKSLDRAGIRYCFFYLAGISGAEGSLHWNPPSGFASAFLE